MNTNQQKILGCSFDGLKDRWVIAGERHSQGKTYAPANVVLPSNQFGQLFTGSQAEEARVSSGLGWPPEARLNLGGFLRRVPVSYAWRLLVDAGDKSVRWSVGDGVSFPLTKILAAHISGRLDGVGNSQDTIVIAIPNELEEFGQDGLLQDLKKQGFQKVQLVWRPVAAALAWLERTQNILPKDIPADDFILVVHLGPDCMEFVPFRLREREFQGKRYVIPLREPPKVRIALGGCDWVAEFIDSTVDAEDPGAFWQALTGFPEIWETLAQRDWNTEQLPHIWSRGDSWELWNPPESLYENMWGLDARTSGRLSELTRGSCRFARQVSSDGSWLHLIETHLKQAADSYRGRLRGIILSGPLASALPSPWLADITPFLEERGLRTSPSTEAVPDRIWIPGFEYDAVSEGAAIYGSRLFSGEPTYLDTLPQLFLLAQDRGTQEWFPLLDAEEVEGGKRFKRVLEQKFSLPRRSNDLKVFLRKGKEQIKKASFNFPHTSDEPMPLDTYIEMSPASGLAQVELVPLYRDFLRGQRVFLDYSRMEDATEADLPKPKLGFPPLAKIRVAPEDHKIWSEVRMVWDEFMAIDISGDLREYCRIVVELKEAVKKQGRFLSESNMWISGRIVDQDGNAEKPLGQELIRDISAKLGRDLRELPHQPLIGTSEQRDDIVRHIRQTATWLFAGAPPEVVGYLKSELEAKWKASARDVIEAASRSFTEVEDLKILYRAIIDRISNPNFGDKTVFPIHSARAIYRVMELRKPAPNAMTRTEAETFVEQALSNMERCVRRQEFKQSFFQAVKLFLYLLRYRKIDQTFLRYDDERDREQFDRTNRCLETARSFFQSKRDYARAEKTYNLREGIKKYRDFEGSPDIIEIINELAE